MSKKRSTAEPEELLLSPEKLEEAHGEWDAQVQRIGELYQQARRDYNQVRAHELWDGWKFMKYQEEQYFATQAELQGRADEALPRKRQRRKVVKAA